MRGDKPSLVTSGVFALVLAMGCSNNNQNAATGGAGGRAGSGGSSSQPTAGSGGAGGAGGTAQPPTQASPGTPIPPMTNCPTPPQPGAAWNQITGPLGVPYGFTVTDAWSAGVDDFFFVGSDPSPAAGPTSTLRRVLRWSAGCWAIELIVNGGINSAPQVSGTATNDVWFTSSDAIYHRDATMWSALDPGLTATITPPAGKALILTDVQARTPTDVWFTTQDTVWRLQNGQWTMQESLSMGPPGQSGSIVYHFNVISIVGPNEVWAGGGSDAIGDTMPPASLYHFDGQTWSIHTFGAYGVNAMWPTGTTAGTFWVGMPPDAVQPLSIREFTGTGTNVTVPAVAGWTPGTEVTSLWGRAAGDIWAAGEDIAHFDGSSWSRVADAPAATRDTTHVHANSVVTGDASSTWLIGVGPQFFRKAAAASP